ncbi:MAG: hypothetical protein WBD31_14030 [Rubripirellula sp.]
MSADTMIDEISPIDPDDELLVAYLDGELEPKQRDELEERLMEEASLRAKLQSLQTGWEMLDALPSPTINERLVESTLELVVSDILKIVPEAALEKKQSFTTRFRMPLIVGGVALATTLAGWAGGYQYRKSIERDQVANLALAENLDAYMWGSDQTLMRKLQADPAWLNMVATAREMGELKSDASTTIRDTPVNQRFGLIESLEDEPRATLESRWDELSQLDPPNLQKVRQVADAVAAQPDAELLLKTMSQYAAWRANLPGEMRDAIEQNEGAKQQSAIAAAITFTLDTVSRRSGSILSDDTVIRIDHALNTFLDERMEADPELKASIERNQEVFGEGARVFMIGRMVSNDSSSHGRPRPGSTSVPKVTLHELDSIIAILSDEAMEDLYLLTNWSPYAGHDPRLLESTLRTWAEEAVRRKMDSLRPERKSLSERYMELSESERDRMDLLPPEEMKRRLTSGGRGQPPFGR